MSEYGDFIAVFDKEPPQLYAVIGVTGPFDSNGLNEIVPANAETETIGSKEVLVFPMPYTLKSILGLSEEYTMYIYKQGNIGSAVFSRNEDKYVEETEKIIESMDIR